MAGRIAAYERWLRIDRADPLTAARARSLYVFTGVFTAGQLVNMAGMAVSYGGWSADHWVSLAAIAVIVAACHAMRWTHRFELHAVFYCGGLIGGALLASRTSGINSALLPMLVWGPVACGLIAGWRSVVGASLAILVLTFHLYGISTAPGSELVTGREFQRLFQANLAVLVSGAIATVFSQVLRRALADAAAAAERARRAERAKSDFLARMSHELRTPLGGVIGLADALASGELGPRERRLTETIRGSGQSMLQILNDLLDLSKIEAGKLSARPAPFSPRALADEVVATWTEAAIANGTALTAEAAGVPDWLTGDALRIRQVLGNFVSNAVKFSPGGAVTLRLEAEPAPGGHALTARVIDNGPGVPTARRDAIFEPFEQGGADTTARYGGTGLGLPICRDLARLMGGEVALARTGPGGSEFTLRLVLPEAEAPAAALPCSPPQPLGPVRVLVADDNAVNRMVAAEFLRELGATAVFATDGREAVASAALGGFDAVLMDKHMPKMDGLAAAAEIRALPGAAGRVPVVAVTADAMAGEREAMLASGFDGFLTKPLRADALREALAAVTKAAPGREAAS